LHVAEVANCTINVTKQQVEEENENILTKTKTDKGVI